MTTTKQAPLADFADLNLDAMNHDELMAFAVAIGHGVRPIGPARQLFPGRSDGIVQVTKSLRGYAWNKATAITCRLDGKIAEAQQYEAICDRIYADLPDWARGW